MKEFAAGKRQVDQLRESIHAHTFHMSQINFPISLSAQANDRLAAIQRGPLVYAYFQAAQPAPVVYNGRRGQFPKDITLCLDPLDPGATILEEPAQAEMLGPMLRIKATVEAQAPIFAQPAGNAELPPAAPQTVCLLPFANQGAVRGEYAVFMEYKN